MAMKDERRTIIRRPLNCLREFASVRSISGWLECSFGPRRAIAFPTCMGIESKHA
jgi:hypothetical protein